MNTLTKNEMEETAMKKIIALFVSIVVLLSACTVFIGAADFAPAGDVEIQWVEDAYSWIELDGNLADWDALGVCRYDLTSHMLDWVNSGAAPASDFNMTAMFLADSYYLYVGLEIRDDEFTKVEYNDAAGIGTYKGDAIQFGFDFGGLQGDIMEIDPEFLVGLAAENSFFSFASRDLTGECTVVAQNTGIYLDGPLDREAYCDQVLAHSAEMYDGAGNVVGWYAEFRIAWDVLFRNAAEKVWLEDEIYFDANNPLEISTLLCYLDMDANNSCSPTYRHAYATYASRGDAYSGGDHKPRVNGLNLYLPYAEDRYIYIDDDRFVQGWEGDFGYPDTEYPGTEYPGTEYPSTEYPGTEYPGTEYPGTEYPGTEYPGTEYPGGVTCPACGHVFTPQIFGVEDTLVGGDDICEPDGYASAEALVSEDTAFRGEGVVITAVPDYIYVPGDVVLPEDTCESANTDTPADTDDFDTGVPDIMTPDRDDDSAVWLTCPACGHMFALNIVETGKPDMETGADRDDSDRDDDDDDDDDERDKHVYTYADKETDADDDVAYADGTLLGCAGVIGATAASAVLVAAAAAIVLKKKD